MTTMASQITSITVVYSTVYSDADQRKHQSSASLAFVWGIHRDRWISRTKGQLRGKCFHLMTSSCERNLCGFYGTYWIISFLNLCCNHNRHHEYRVSLWVFLLSMALSCSIYIIIHVFYRMYNNANVACIWCHVIVKFSCEICKTRPM